MVFRVFLPRSTDSAPIPPPKNSCPTGVTIATSARLTVKALLSYLAMLEGPGVHFVNKWNDALLKSHYVLHQKIGSPRQDLRGNHRLLKGFLMSTKASAW